MTRLRVSFAVACLLLFAVAAAGAPPAGVGLKGQTAVAPVVVAQDSGQPSGAPARAIEPVKKPEKEVGKGYRLSPERYHKAVALARARNRLYFFSAAYGLLVLLAVLRWRLAPKYRSWAERVSSRRFVQALVFTPLFLLSIKLLGLPTDIYSHWLERKYERSIQGWGSWAGDWAKGEMVGLIVGTILVWILYGVIRRSARRWWFYFWLAALPILLFVFFLSPLVIDPLFFTFKPLQDRQPQLVAELERVVQRGGLAIPPERMFEMDASKKRTTLNAYVTGIGASKRVVVWDTTIARMTTPQTMFVFGHEMGHYVLGHIPRAIAFSAALFLALLFLGYRGARWAIERSGTRWAIHGVDDWASLPVLLLFVSLCGFFTTPIFNSFSRYQEHQADIYGLEVIHGLVPSSGEVAGQAFQILGEIGLADPNPSAFIRFWRYTHPPISERIAFARTYDPLSKGQSPQFVK